MRYARRRSNGGLLVFIVIMGSIFIIVSRLWIPVVLFLGCFIPLYIWERKQAERRSEEYRLELKEKYGAPNESIAVMIETINKLLLFEKQLTSNEKKQKQQLMQSFNRLIEKNGTGYVYFVKAHGTDGIKIGKADDPLKRIVKGFGVKIHVQLELLYLIRTHNPYATEHQFHEYFRTKRINGEWFNLTNDDMKWVRSADYPLAIYRTIQVDM